MLGKMVQGKVCRFNQFGYCKFGRTCFRIHENKECENEHCETQSCLLRHPRRCRFFSKYNYCKFGTFCRFKPDSSAHQETHKEIELLKKALDTVNQKLMDKEEEILRKEYQIKAFEDLREEKQNLETENLELKQKVQDLQNDLAVKDMLQMDFKERVQEKYGYDSNDEESDYEPDEEIRLNNRINFRLKKVEELRKRIKCEICDYTTKSETGMKTHKTKKHKETRK